MIAGRIVVTLVLGLVTSGTALAQPGAPPLPAGHPAVAPTSLPAGHPAVAPASLPAGHPAVAPGASAAPLPAGHPAVNGAATGDMPPGHPAVDGAAPGDMPPGHPAVGGGTAPGHAPPPEDMIDAAPELPKGTIEAVLLDPDERPLAGIDVRLGILFQKIAEGESRSEKHAKTGADGVARFDGLEHGSTYAYRITTKSGPGEFASSPFNLKEAGGMRVRLHVFPVVQNLEGSMVGMRGMFYVETRDEVFQIQGIFRVMNLGRTAWVPGDVVIGLPKDFKAFAGEESMFDTRFEAAEGRGAKLVGTFPPGQRDVNFHFQVPKPNDTTAFFAFAPAPRTMEIRVIAVANQAMGLDVEGWDATQTGTGPSGDRVLVTRKAARSGDPQIAPFVVTLTGLPVPGPGRWIAIAIAFSIALVGGLAAAGKLRLVSTEKVESDRARACNLLLEELVQVTRASERGEIGPQTHEQTRRRLIDALSRIGLPRESRKKRVPKPARA